MILGPLVTFFIMNAMFSNSLVSGGTAAAVANVVLISYVYLAFNEDISDEANERAKDK